MFVVLKTALPEKNYLKRRKQIKKARKSLACAYKSCTGLPFYILEIVEPEKDSDYLEISKKCGKYASRIIAPHSFPLPDNSGLRRFIPVSMNSFLVFNTALSAIQKSSLPADKMCITVTDRNAVVNSRICELLPYASTIRIITSHPERYALAVADAYENHGASLVLRNIYEPVSQPEIVICCDGAVLSSMNKAAVFVTKRKTGGKVRFNGNGVELSEFHKELIPDNIETVDFAGALTELCGSPEYKHSPFSSIEISCTECENPTAEKCLECCICNQTVT